MRLSGYVVWLKVENLGNIPNTNFYVLNLDDDRIIFQQILRFSNTRCPETAVKRWNLTKEAES